MKVIGHMWAKDVSSTLILGKPMLWWSLIEGKKTSFSDGVFVLAENDELAQIARECECHAIVRKPDQVFHVKESKNPNEWCQFLNDEVSKVCGTLGDVLVFLSGNSCLMTPEVLEDMFVKLMEDMVSDTIGPVTKIDPYLLMKNPVSDHFFPFWFEPGMDRQDYPGLYRAGSVRIQHALRRPGVGLLYHEVAPEYVFEVNSQEDIGLVEYYLGLRLGGKIVLPHRGEAEH